MSLRVIAVAPPGLPEGGLGRHTLKSADPASLFNACRVAAQRADEGVGAWGRSNWAVPRQQRRDLLLLMHSLKEDLPEFEALLERERPHLLLLGAMTMCLPGAVACAAKAKEILGDEVCVVLGGRHASETIHQSGDTVRHEVSSPCRLMAEAHVPAVFDLVVSGEGEHLIAEIGEAVETLMERGLLAADLRRRLDEIKQAPGTWVLSRYADGLIDDLVGRSGAIDRNLLPPPARVFGVRTAFDVFDGRLTGHVFSDTGNGCVFDCDFCSERKSVTGGLLQFGTGADRLMRQLQAVVDAVEEDFPGRGASAFVEDSTLLGGSPQQIDRLAGLLSRAELDIRFGGQFTIDQIRHRADDIRKLSEVGFDYVFIGVETLDPSIIGGMSKDRRSRAGQWMSRTEQAVESLADMGVRAGSAVLFGLGERQEHRLALLQQLAQWKEQYGSPSPISLNWAAQHPLRNSDLGYRYHEWSVPAGEWIDLFEDFGEASAIYPLKGVEPPVKEEVGEVRAAFQELFVNT
ncbi:B12-binding domain/radical SAM domain-containing protein [Streptomyces sp. NPDC087294]|uniref:B12-binding domain/radical SAM domain-containing protein n=1 Tax=Streptomyces sp. NPDC087294 TaxID=3365777 RepID=UPI0038127CEE